MNTSELDDPLSKLLASVPPQPTVLDEHYQKMAGGQTNQNSEDSEKNGTNLHRQSSHSSFHGTIITNGSEKHSNSSNIAIDPDPILVFDGHSDTESDNEPIGLGVRQPSFVSLHGQIIPKGADSLADLQPVIEEVIDEPPKEIPEYIREESDPQVKTVKRLQAKNAERWAEIGYEPPQDLIPLVRAKSQAQMHKTELTRNGYMTTSLSKFYTSEHVEKASGKIPDDLGEIEDSPVVPEVLKEAPTPNRKRSGSFGMKLGEASASMELMQLIMPEEMEKKPEIPEEVIEEKEQVDADVEEEKEEENILYGHLNEIVTEDCDSPVYQTILTGENPPHKAIAIVKVALRKYLKIAEENKWTDEASFLSNLLEDLPVTTPKKSPKKSQRSSPVKNNTGKESPRRKKTPKSPKDESKLERMLAKLDNDYKKESEALDEYWQSEDVRNKYSKPSIELLDLRSKLRKAQRAKKNAEAARLEKKISTLEAKETAEMEKALQHDYFAADKKLKQKYAIKRETIVKTYEFKQKKSTATNSNTSVLLQLKSPTKINRDNDLSIIKEMTKEALDGKDVSQISIERIFNKIVQK